jgi:hypothetical protein
MHTRGTDRLGLWREKDGGMIDDSVVGAERKAMRELFNKAASVCKMIQGPNSPEEIDHAHERFSLQLVHNQESTDLERLQRTKPKQVR